MVTIQLFIHDWIVVKRRKEKKARKARKAMKARNARNATKAKVISLVPLKKLLLTETWKTVEFWKKSFFKILF